ncbi:MFS general substrate transporter [Ganoderma sinense ZZ0214-1]|uniref:MFS general substrate transporter n=1 Tax=Ganoderma sinense ZZ0214-1 TaxID=1077348 RepID=A0A2G8S0T0_9APHY|nr:MFS general substrate transporter [Ganoderma sinense ZZ0214-1]
MSDAELEKNATASTVVLDVVEKGDRDRESTSQLQVEEFDFLSYHEHNAGRLIVDPEEARREFGDAVADRLKLSQDGTKVLWPQPLDDPEDPQNWTEFRKNVQLLVITLAAITPDFESALGVAALFPLATEFGTTTGYVNNLTTNWSVFLLGWGGIFAVMLMHRFGRLPVLFWSQILATGWLVGCTFAPNLRTFAAMRCLNSFFATTPQVTGLYVVTDLFPFHMQARKLNIWTMGFIISPFLSPFMMGFIVAHASWRWTYGIATIYNAIVVCVIAFVGEETMYNRKLPNPHPIPRPSSTLLYRFQTLVGLTGARMAKYRDSWRAAIFSIINIIWRPHLFMILLFQAAVFGFSIGTNNTNVVLLGTPPPGGYGFSTTGIAGAYGTPIVAVLVGEVLGRYFNDWVMNISIRRNNGVFIAENRLWTCYIGTVLYVTGFVTLGAAFQEHLSIGALVMGWGISGVAVMINTVSIYAYCNDCFPRHQGEISGLINLARTLGGFGVAYFQIPWAEKSGALQTFGVEVAVVAGLFLLIVPTLQLKGAALRARYSP